MTNSKFKQIDSNLQLNSGYILFPLYNNTDYNSKIATRESSEGNLSSDLVYVSMETIQELEKVLYNYFGGFTVDSPIHKYKDANKRIIETRAYRMTFLCEDNREVRTLLSKTIPDQLYNIYPWDFIEIMLPSSQVLLYSPDI